MTGEGQRSASSSTEAVFFGVVLAVLIAASLEPLWSQTVPALQDYPNHLAQVEVLLADDDSSLRTHLHGELRAKPYVGFYAVVVGLVRSLGLGLETAGRLCLSFYVGFFALLILRIWRRAGVPPWGSLILLPLAFHLSYYLGFLNYLLSLPLLALSLFEFEAWLAGESPRSSGCWLALWVLGLYFTHPFTFLAFVGLASLRLLFSERRWAPRNWLPIAIAGALFASWLFIEVAGQGASDSDAHRNISAAALGWRPFTQNLSQLVYPFTGMQSLGSASPSFVLVWLGLGALLVNAFVRGGLQSEAQFWALAFVLTTLFVFIMPFRMGLYTYVNWRIGAVSYLCLGMLASFLRFERFHRLAFILLVGLAIGLSGAHQRRVSAELEEVLPLLKLIPADRAMLPLIFDNNSKELDPQVFDPHLHVHNYYHVRGGRGLTPYLFSGGLGPVGYRAGSPPAAPPHYRPQAFDWRKHTSWEFLLVRAAPERFLAGLRVRAEEIARSGPWRLFQVTAGANSRSGVSP